ncbi:MAG: SMI1/KNR4 family protein [Planctomycetaceae bacterium]
MITNSRGEEIRWVKCNEPVSREIVQNVEEHFDVKFPELYVEIVQHYNGGVPRPNDFQVPTFYGTTTFSYLTPINDGVWPNGREYQGMIRSNDELRRFRPWPKNVFMFSDDGGELLICFDYRNVPPDKPDEPQIILIESNGTEHFVCNTFAELIASLHDAPDEVD